jgi:hypothetical protein
MEQAALVKADLKLVLSENGDVCAITEKGAMNLGPQDEVCEAMCRFLSEVDFGDCR